MIKVKWWHAYKGSVPDVGSLAIYLSECDDDPEMLVYKGNLSFEVPMFGHDVTVTYVRSWDHDPTEAEKVAAGLDDDDD